MTDGRARKKRFTRRCHGQGLKRYRMLQLYEHMPAAVKNGLQIFQALKNGGDLVAESQGAEGFKIDVCVKHSKSMA